MGSIIKFELNDQQRNGLENGYRNGKCHVFRLRCHMILLKSEGRKSKEEDAIFGSCKPSVNAWLWRYINEGINGLHNKPEQGRIPILQPSQDAQSVRSSDAQHRQRISQAGADLEDSLGKKFSEKTLRSFIKYKAAESGIAPAYTSKSCSNCFALGKRRKHKFSCSTCGYLNDADVNAARCIAALRAQVKRPEVAVLYERQAVCFS